MPIRARLDRSRARTEAGKVFGQFVTLTMWRLHDPIHQTKAAAYLSTLNRAVWLPKFGSPRHPEPVHPEVSKVGDLWLYRRPWHNVCRCPGLARHASASVCCGNKPEDGGDHGCLPDIVGLLRTSDFVAADNCMECDWNLYQFVERRRVRLFRE
jgi:hypothetical protein